MGGRREGWPSARGSWRCRARDAGSFQCFQCAYLFVSLREACIDGFSVSRVDKNGRRDAFSLSSNLFSRPRAIVKFSTLSCLRHRFRAQPVSFVCLFEQICRRRSLPAFRALDPLLLETRGGKNGGIRGTLMRRSNDLWKGDEYYYVMLLRCKTRYWNFVIETWFRAWPDPFE